MQWLHNLRQSFSSQRFIEHIWEPRRRRGGHWKREATHHGRYSSHFLLAAHLTSAMVSRHSKVECSVGEAARENSMKTKLYSTISMFPEDVAKLLRQEVESIGLPCRRIAFSCICFSCYCCQPPPRLIFACQIVLPYVSVVWCVVTHLSGRLSLLVNMPMTLIMSHHQFCAVNSVQSTLALLCYRQSMSSDNGNDNHENDKDKHQQDNGHGRDVYRRCPYDVHEGCASANDRGPVCLVSFGGRL